ncbi:glycosyltransferase [Alkalimarinus sediminis]|uniref:Glycosyltransferase n=1 Tax=Alkalimarinus sediminis TaxID=1632866 RepID=A0A9E8HKT4_9ALTE|nr:glycosyltransferase family 2 protein [Alkalimarinus sediminis]UZW76165.1 glycosyltransferase [Alkalimarinus sediminis]
MDVSVIFATCNRDDILKNTLDSFTHLATRNFAWEVIVVDNAVRQQTKTLVNSYKDMLPITYLTEATPGKNNALIKALPSAQGDLLVFTDDDIIAHPDWLEELWSGAERYPAYDMFGGTIKPHYPDHPIDPRINLNHHFINDAYVVTDTKLKEGEIRAGKIWGPNMAIRRKIIDSGINFNPNIGPNGQDYVMGSETEFLLRAAKAGHSSVFLPKAVVKHQIRQNQLSLEWLAGRAFRHGKGNAAVTNTDQAKQKILFGAPRFLYKKLLAHKLLMISSRLKTQHTQYFSHFVRYHFIRGQIHQSRIIAQQS